MIYFLVVTIIYVVMVFILNRTNMELKRKKKEVIRQLEFVVEAYNQLAKESSDLLEAYEEHEKELEEVKTEVKKLKKQLLEAKEEANI